jgi:hypothetical protein
MYQYFCFSFSVDRATSIGLNEKDKQGGTALNRAVEKFDIFHHFFQNGGN